HVENIGAEHADPIFLESDRNLTPDNFAGKQSDGQRIRRFRAGTLQGAVHLLMNGCSQDRSYSASTTRSLGKRSSTPPKTRSVSSFNGSKIARLTALRPC